MVKLARWGLLGRSVRKGRRASPGRKVLRAQLVPLVLLDLKALSALPAL